MLSHPHVIGCYGNRTDLDVLYIFLEYASGGELFDRIEPDIGMSQKEAQKYFRELISGMLISGANYKAQPSDIWSCGVVLVACLSGELPWDTPQLSCSSYKAWTDVKITEKPWCKIDYLALSLIRIILHSNPQTRATLSKIQSHAWFMRDFTLASHANLSENKSPDVPIKGMRVDHVLVKRDVSADVENGSVVMSQPTHLNKLLSHNSNSVVGNDGSSNAQSRCAFSQPVSVDSLYISNAEGSSTAMTSSVQSQTPLQRLVRRMTRVKVAMTLSNAMIMVSKEAEKMNLGVKTCMENSISISTTDRRRCPLDFRIFFYDMVGNVLIDFRLSRGCGIEFKRTFQRIKASLHSIVGMDKTNIWLSSQPKP